MIPEHEFQRIKSGLMHALDGPHSKNQILTDFWKCFQELKELRQLAKQLARLDSKEVDYKPMLDGIMRAVKDYCL